MGTKYTSQSASGYNSSPPADDGSTNASNRVLWSTIKNKLADPTKTLADGVNSALVTAFDTSARAITSNDSAAATDHDRVIQVNTSTVVVTLADAATMAAGYMVGVHNNSTGNITITRATGADTINGLTKNLTIGAQQRVNFRVNAAANGYILESANPRQQTRQVLTSGTGATYTTPDFAVRLVVRMVGGGGGGGARNTNNGADGTDTTFGTLTASKGTGGGLGGNPPGTGGTGTNGDVNIGGGGGGSGTPNAVANNFPAGGAGGNSAFGGGGAGGNQDGAGGNAGTNSGGGGGGGGGTSTSNSGSGGGAGGYVEKLITSPSATYTYTVGAGGNGGAAGSTAGGNGAAGIIIVDEFYS